MSYNWHGVNIFGGVEDSTQKKNQYEKLFLFILKIAKDFKYILSVNMGVWPVCRTYGRSKRDIVGVKCKRLVLFLMSQACCRPDAPTAWATNILLKLWPVCTVNTSSNKDKCLVIDWYSLRNTTGLIQNQTHF